MQKLDSLCHSNCSSNALAPTQAFSNIFICQNYEASIPQFWRGWRITKKTLLSLCYITPWIMILKLLFKEKISLMRKYSLMVMQNVWVSNTTDPIPERAIWYIFKDKKYFVDTRIIQRTFKAVSNSAD